MRLTVFAFFLIGFLHCVNAQNADVQLKNDTLVVHSDSILAEEGRFTLLDSLRNDSIVRAIFNKTIALKGISSIQNTSNQESRDLPFLKQIKVRKIKNDAWKFYFILFLLIYLASVRLFNVRNFDFSISILFDIYFLQKINRLKDSKFTWATLHLFIIYVLSLSLLLNQLFENNQIFNQTPSYSLIWLIAANILIIYVIKFLVNLLVGYILDDVKSTTRMIINTIQISNFTGIIMLIFSVFYVYLFEENLAQAVFLSISTTFFVGILYRNFRYLVNQTNRSALPFFYLFIYLCALEISPWLIFIKILNNYLS